MHGLMYVNLCLAFCKFSVTVNNSVFSRSPYIRTVLYVPVTHSGTVHSTFTLISSCPHSVLCYVMSTNIMQTFQINVLIQFFLSSTCFEHLMFIIRKAVLYMQHYMVRFSC